MASPPAAERFVCAPCTPLTCVFVQGLEENLREAQAAAQRLETHLKQKEKLYEDKIKVGEPESLLEISLRHSHCEDDKCAVVHTLLLTGSALSIALRGCFWALCTVCPAKR